MTPEPADAMATIRQLRAENQEMCLQYLATAGQAQEALTEAEALRAQLATARNDALSEAIGACVKYRHLPDTTQSQACGAMECALLISALKGPTP